MLYSGRWILGMREMPWFWVHQSNQWCKKFCNSEHMFWIWTFHNLFQVKTTRRTKTTLGGHGGELPSERQTRALAAHMNGIRERPFPSFIVSGCPWQQALEESRWHVMWCRGLDARWLHRTATLMIWATFHWPDPYEALEVPCRDKPVLPCFITQCARKLSQQMSSHLDQDNLIHRRTRLRNWKTRRVREERRGRGGD